MISYNICLCLTSLRMIISRSTHVVANGNISFLWLSNILECIYVCVCVCVYIYIYIWPTPQPQQYRIWAASAAYTTDHGNARSLTYWARPGACIYIWHLKPIICWWALGFFPCLGYCSLFFFVFFFRAAPMACGGSQAGVESELTGLVCTVAHSNMGSKPCLRPTSQFTATVDP